MSRSIAGFLWALAAVAPVQAQSFLPLEPDHRWEFATTEEVQAAGVKTRTTGTARLVCVEGVQVDGQQAFVLGWKGEFKRLVVSATADAITVHSHTDGVFLLPANFADPKGSAKRVRVGTVEVEDHLVGAAERVKTPAGTFEAVPVSAVVKAPASEVRLTVWYARGVGPVKSVEVVKAPATSITRTLLLQSYSFAPGGAPDPDAVEEPTDPAQPEHSGTPEAPSKAPREAISLSALVDQGAAADLGPLLERVVELKRQAASATGAAVNGTVPQGKPVGDGKAFAVNSELDHARVVCRGLVVNGTLNHCLVVCDGDVTINGDVQHSVVIASGRLTVAGELGHSLSITQGAISLAGELHHGTAVSHGALTVSGEARHCVLECARVSALGSLEHCVFLNTPAAPGDANQAKRCAPTLRELLPLK